MSEVLLAGKHKSYGVREEHRISLAFFDRMQAALQAARQWEQPAVQMQHAAPYWRLSSETYLSHLLRNTNKFAFGLEWLLGQQKDHGISYAHSMVLQMLLQALRCSFDSVSPQQQPSLWKTCYQ